MYRLQSPNGTVHRPKTDEARDALLALGYEDLGAASEESTTEEDSKVEEELVIEEDPAPKRTRAPRKPKEDS